MSENTAVVLNNSNEASKAKVGRPFNPNSKLVQCKALFIELAKNGKNRAEILTEFVNRFGLEVGSAQVYYHDAKNAAEAAGQHFKIKRSPSKPRVVVKTTEGISNHGTTDAGATAQATETNAENGQGDG